MTIKPPRIERYQGTEDHFECTEIEITEGSTLIGIFVNVFDENDRPMVGLKVEHFYPQPPRVDHREFETVQNKGDEAARAEFTYTPRDSHPDGTGYGPHNIKIKDFPSDIVWGMGTEGNAHRLFRLVMHKRLGAPVQPPPPPPPPPQPPAGTIDLRPAIEDLELLIAGLRVSRASMDQRIVEAESTLEYIKGLR